MNKTNHFYPLRGLCQEDHFSSYLFVYGDITAKYILDGDRQPYGRAKILFLFFASDVLLLFVKANH